MITSPTLGSIEQCPADPAGAVIGSHSQVLYPGSLPESYGDNVEIDSCKPNDCVFVVCDQDGRPIVSHGCFQTTNSNSLRPVVRAYPGRREQPVVGGRYRRRIGGTRVPDDAFSR
jgi:hypothetical protein